MIATRCLSVIIALLTLGAIWIPGNALAQDRVVFLRLEVTIDSVALIRSSVVEGLFKQPRVPDTSRAIQYRVFLDDGTEWTVGSRDDARIRRYEYEYPDHPGQLRSHVVTLDSAPLVLRIQYHELLSYVECYRKPILESEVTKDPGRRPFGRFELDLTGEVGHE